MTLMKSRNLLLLAFISIFLLSCLSGGDNLTISKTTLYQGGDRTMGAYYSENEEEFEKGVYIFSVHSDSLLGIAFNQRPYGLRLIKKINSEQPDAFEEWYEGDGFKIHISMKYQKKGDYKCKRYEGRMTVMNENDKVLIAQQIYGQSAWKTVYTK